MVSIQKLLSIFNSKFIVKFVVGLLILIMPIIAVAKLIWYPKDFMYNFYSMDKGAFEVEFFGSSHCFCSVNPAVLYEDYGITSYDLGGISQHMPQTYYYMREAIKRNKPKVAVIEVFKTYADSTYSDYFTASNTNLQSLIPSVNKAKALLVCHAEYPLAKFFNVAMSHGGFKDLTESDYQLTREYDKNLGYVGYDIVYEHQYNEVPEEWYKGIEEAIPVESEEYLRKCIELCLNNDVEPILFCAPFPSVSEKNLKQYNYIQSIANEYQIQFFNGCLVIEDMKIDFSKDFEDESGHLNYFGAEKFSKYFGKWLIENARTQFGDARDNNRKSGKPNWDEVVANWESTKLRYELSKAETKEEYIEVLTANGAPYVEIRDGNYEVALKDMISGMSIRERRNVLFQMNEKVADSFEELGGEGSCFFVYNKYGIDEVSIRTFEEN